MYFENSGAGLTSTDLISGIVTFYCGGATPTSTSSPCCPPDPIATGYLQQILQAVTLIQRQAVPFAYISATAHPGLTGNGTIAVNGILGIRVDVTTLPARAGSEAGDPVAFWDIGWINLGTADGFSPRQFIASNPMLIQPILGDVTVIAYSIPADTTITITELVREP
jgi:hypothetical protein